MTPRDLAIAAKVVAFFGMIGITVLNCLIIEGYYMVIIWGVFSGFVIGIALSLPLPEGENTSEHSHQTSD